jgi:DNA mismatch repair protein MutH
MASSAPMRSPPPRDVNELLARARALEGRTLGEIAREVGAAIGDGGLRAKGKLGAAVELSLGATGGSQAVPDFPELGVELKTIPVDPRGVPRESTFVCALSLADADRAEWATSWVRQKLSCVLFLPIETPEGLPAEARRVGPPLLFRPTPAQEAVLAADFDDVMGLVGAGRVEELDARVGRWLQARPKAAHGRVRTRAYGPEGEPLDALPRGFYLRARFTGAILRDPAALPA